MKESAKRILIIGMSAGGADSLPASLLKRIEAADLLMGGRRHLQYFPNFAGQTFIIEADIEAVAQRLRQALAQGEQAVVLASGDPLCYGIGASLRRYFPAEKLEIIPSASAFQLAFAALAEPWSDTALLSAHARPLADVVAGVLTALKAAILTDNQQTPVVIAGALLKANLPPDCACAICENLGSANQRIIRTTLGQVGERTYASLNVFIIWNNRAEENSPLLPYSSACTRMGAPPLGHPPGLPDDTFSTTAGQITKREIRLLSLAELALGAGEIMWDIGAGSGAVGLEAARMQPAAAVYAIEKRAEMCGHIRENLRRFPAPNFHLTQGIAPDDLTNWPDPHAVFIGGSGGQLEAILDTAKSRLYPGGRLVINLATLENLQAARSLLPEARFYQAQINRSVPILEMTRFEALNPIFIVTWKK